MFFFFLFKHKNSQIDIGESEVKKQVPPIIVKPEFEKIEIKIPKKEAPKVETKVVTKKVIEKVFIEKDTPKDKLLIRKELGLEDNIDAFDLPIIGSDTEIIDLVRELTNEQIAALTPMERKIWQKSLQGVKVKKIYKMFKDEEVSAYRTISKMLYSKLIALR